MARLSLAALLAKIDSLFADNEAGNISEADLREVQTDIKDSFAHLDVTDGLAQDIIDLGASVAADLVTLDEAKQDKGASKATGLTLRFDANRQYGDDALPENGPNIGYDSTNAIVGVEVGVVHNAGAEPTYNGVYKKLAFSSAYQTGANNYYKFRRISATQIIFWISN